MGNTNSIGNELGVVPAARIMNPSWIAGVDGFRSKWFVVLVNHTQGRVIETRHQVCAWFKDFLNLTPAPKVIAIHIPIGLLGTPGYFG